MIDRFFETDLAQVDPSAFTDIQRLPMPGTTGMVFRATERQSGMVVAVKISYPEESSKGGLLAEAAALSAPIKDVAEPGCEPTARAFYRRFDPFARVGLVMEWLDDSYTPLEKLVRDPNLKLTDLQVLRIVAPFTALLATAHRCGFVYVDIDAQKADHLWWRVQKSANGQWCVPRDGDERPRFQLKVIDWANALNMDDPAYTGNVTPADDIAGVGELLFYMLHGPGAPMPASPNDAALQPQRGNLDDLIRRAMFIDAEDSFVKEAQKGLTPRERTDLLRNPEQRAAAAMEFDKAVREMFDRLNNRYQMLINKARDTVIAINIAAEHGLLALNKAIPQELEKLYGAGAKPGAELPELNAQAIKLVGILYDLLARAKEIDPDQSEADMLEAGLAKIDKIMAERRGLENVRRLLLQMDMAPPLDMKRVTDAIDKVRKDGQDITLAEDLTLLEQVAQALEAAGKPLGQPGEGFNPVEAKAILPSLIEHALDMRGLLEPPGAPQARETVLGLGHWGDSASMLALRLNIARRAGVEIMRDQVAALLGVVEQTLIEVRDYTTKSGVPKTMQAQASATLANLQERTGKLHQAFDTLIKEDGSQDYPSLESVMDLYDALSVAVGGLLSMDGVQLPFSIEQRAVLINMLEGVKSGLADMEAALGSGDIAKALAAITNWAEHDPQSLLAQRYIRFFDQNRALGREKMIGSIQSASASGLERLLQALEMQTEQPLLVAPQSPYFMALRTLGAATAPLAGVLARKRSLRPIVAYQEEDGHTEMAKAVGNSLCESLVAALSAPQPPQLANNTQPRPTEPAHDGTSHAKHRRGAGRALYNDRFLAAARQSRYAAA